MYQVELLGSRLSLSAWIKLIFSHKSNSLRLKLRLKLVGNNLKIQVQVGVYYPFSGTTTMEATTTTFSQEFYTEFQNFRTGGGDILFFLECSI